MFQRLKLRVLCISVCISQICTHFGHVFFYISPGHSCDNMETRIALAEARDISIHLNPLQKHFTQIEETDFAEAKPLLEPLMHVICMVWSRSRYYCQSSKITVLLRQICNLLIHQVNKILKYSNVECVHERGVSVYASASVNII